MTDITPLVKKYTSQVGALGSNDCLHFALEGSAYLGKYDFTKVIPNYKSKTEALRWLLRNKYGTLAGCFDAHVTRIPPLQAVPGDLCIDPDGNPTFGWVGLVVGFEAAFLKPGVGLKLRRFKQFTTWRVPDASSSC